MRRAAITLVLAAGVLHAPAQAQQAPASPLLGSWAVDVAQLPVPPEARPQSVTFTFSEAGEGRWTTQVVIVAADGTSSVSEVTHDLAGTPAHVANSIEADTVAISTPSPEVLIMALSNKGVPSSMRVFTVAPDGQSQTETAVYYRQDGTPAMRKAYFTRVR